jgi:hypothetical protein
MLLAAGADPERTEADIATCQEHWNHECVAAGNPMTILDVSISVSETAQAVFMVILHCLCKVMLGWILLQFYSHLSTYGQWYVGLPCRYIFYYKLVKLSVSHVIRAFHQNIMLFRWYLQQSTKWTVSLHNRH